MANRLKRRPWREPHGPFGIRATPVRYSTLDYCIYCGRTDDLTDEHLIPFSLDGNYVLPKSVCRYHHGLTSRMDQICTRKMFGAWRTRLHMQTTNPDDRMTEVDLYSMATARDLQARPVGRGPSELCASLTLPTFPIPRILSGASKEPDGNPWPLASIWIHRPPPQPFGMQNLYGRGTLEIDAFGRMIAKMAFGLTMAAFGGRFRPLIREVILGQDNDPQRLVGTDPRRWPPAPHLHWHGWNLRPGADGNTYLQCAVRLFNGFGAPTYCVVVGDQLEGFADDDALAAHARGLDGGGANFLVFNAGGNSVTVNE